MSPTAQKAILTLAAVILGTLFTVPEFTAAFPIIAKLCGPVAGVLGGWAHLEKPGTAAKIEAARLSIES